MTEESQMAALLARAATNRAVARTDMNERSSRSHSVFRLRIAGTNSQTGWLLTASTPLLSPHGQS